jgi:hypothetical protein
VAPVEAVFSLDASKRDVIDVKMMEMDRDPLFILLYTRFQTTDFCSLIWTSFGTGLVIFVVKMMEMDRDPL